MHGPSMAEIEVKKSLARMKEVASSSQDAPSRIVNKELQSSLPAEYRAYLPKEAAVKRKIQRECRERVPEPPKTLSDLELYFDVFFLSCGILSNPAVSCSIVQYPAVIRLTACSCSCTKLQ